MNKKTILSIAALTLALSGGFVGINKVYADETTEKFRPMLQRIAERFGLDQTEIETFMIEHRETIREEKRQGMEARINQAAEEGQLTESQKNSLLAKMGEICDGTGERKGELREWAEENGINLRELNIGQFGLGNGSRGIGRSPQI